MQLTINSFRPLFPDNIFSLTLPWLLVKSLTFPWQLSNSLTFPGFLDKWSPWHSSSHMRVINNNLSAMKQRLHPQSVADISHHSVLSGDRIRQCETSSGSRHKDTEQCKSPFPSAGTAVSLFRAKRFSRDHCCRGRSKPGCRMVGSHTRWENWPPEPTSSYASINFWCQLVASPATAASWVSVVAIVG